MFSFRRNVYSREETKSVLENTFQATSEASKSQDAQGELGFQEEHEPAQCSKDDAQNRLFEDLEARLLTPEFAERLRRLREGENFSRPIPSNDDFEEEFVVVDKEDAIESMLEIIAESILACPEAQELTPDRLQAAIVKACQDLKESRLKTAWGWCKFIYRTASWTYAAINVYINPWAVRALLCAFWAMPQILKSYFG